VGHLRRVFRQRCRPLGETRAVMWRVPLILVPTTESSNGELAITFD